ncbi:unnamed protein product [Adineta steineri]|uniref:Uncharacterized protein n=1 Tax=Adineta steineri TaxID=433720 RepID=A0A816F8U8_9BILA|nr:unnamed protein product [Adineta steineri]CAF1542488.1 unnamed protein product [Adineta steineri]CAF1658034.1 unnamed protein product [Adineta steineri]CAF3903458.1 unnamed protein product [Adineta steineri]
MDFHICERLNININEFSSSFTYVNNYTTIHNYFGVSDDSDEESYLDPQTEDIDSDLGDHYYDDLENLILDEIELEDAVNNNDDYHFS